MLFIIPAIAIMLIALLNYKTGFLLYLLFQMIWFPDAQVFQIGDSWVNINLICAVFFVLLYRLKKGRFSSKTTPFPYTNPMIAIAISLLMTCITSYSGVISELVKGIGLIFIDLLVIYVMWNTLNSRKDYAFLYKGLTVIMLFACIYIFYEKVTSQNPILDYKLTTTTSDLFTYREASIYENRGYRCYSIFDHTISACMTFALYIVLTANLYIKKKRYPIKTLSLITSFLCIPAMFFTKQRAGMFLLLIALLSIVDFRKKRFWKLIGIAALSIACAWPFISNYIALFLSIFNSSYQGQVFGSTSSMRFKQLYAVFKIMQMAPITGLGENFQRYYHGMYAAQALGYESLWFEQMAKHGILGVLAYVYLIYYSVYKVPKRYHSKQVLFISLAYWITYTLTSTPYFRTYFLYGVLFYFIKNTPELNLTEAAENNHYNKIRLRFR